jgi:hypothetical protein
MLIAGQTRTFGLMILTLPAMKDPIPQANHKVQLNRPARRPVWAIQHRHGKAAAFPAVAAEPDPSP